MEKGGLMNIPGVSPLPAYYSVAKPSRSQQPPVLNSEGAQSAPTQPDGGGDGGQPSNSSTSPDYLAIDTLAALLSAQGKSVVAPNMALALTHDPSSDNGSPSSSTVSSTGKGRYEGHDCPECGGNAQMQRRFADKIDLNDYSKVDCPVCDGKGRRKGDDCPVCGGEGQDERGGLVSTGPPGTRGGDVADCQ